MDNEKIKVMFNKLERMDISDDQTVTSDHIYKALNNEDEDTLMNDAVELTERLNIYFSTDLPGLMEDNEEDFQIIDKIKDGNMYYIDFLNNAIGLINGKILRDRIKDFWWL